MTRQALILLAPPQTDKRAHPVCERAAAFFSDPENFATRKTWAHQLIRRVRAGNRDEPVRKAKGKGIYAPAQLTEYEKERRVHVAADLFRMLAWAGRSCDWRTYEIGDFREGRVHYPSRASICDGAGNFPVRVDKSDPEHLRVRCYKGDRRIKDLTAAGFFCRVQVDGAPSVFKVTELFWQVCGLAKARKRAEWEEDEKKRVAAQRRRPSPVDQLVGQLAGAADERRRETDPYENERGWRPRRKPPPS